MKRYVRYLNFDMEYILKLFAICVTAAVFSLTIRKTNPELSLLLGVATAILCIISVVDLFHIINEQLEKWNESTMISYAFFIPMIKCLGISVLSQFGINICKDAGQSASAMALELCGNTAAVWCLLPLINQLFDLLEDML